MHGYWWLSSGHLIKEGAPACQGGSVVALHCLVPSLFPCTFKVSTPSAGPVKCRTWLPSSLQSRRAASVFFVFSPVNKTHILWAFYHCVLACSWVLETSRNNLNPNLTSALKKLKYSIQVVSSRRNVPTSKKKNEYFGSQHLTGTRTHVCVCVRARWNPRALLNCRENEGKPH